ncbi:hypothetical protein GF342_02520 [Candidatus Woesearchaeota archaeon]|nr:hypothetical protein [Candidatus Woesearchaeota archaeon]
MYIALVFAILLIATYTDLRWREVPDWISYSGILAGIGLHAIQSITEQSVLPLLHGIGGLTFTSILGVGLFYLGQWGGGDSKALMAMGSLIGLEPRLDSTLFTFLCYLAIVGGLYGIIWTVGSAAQHWSRVSIALRQRYTRGIMTAQLALILLALGITGTAIHLAPTSDILIASFLLAFLLPLTFFLFTSMRVIEQHCFFKEIHVRELTEGDWIAHDIIHDGKRLCGPQDLGISTTQIAQVQEAGIQKILIKTGMPFLPAFLMAFILTTILGSLLPYLF